MFKEFDLLFSFSIFIACSTEFIFSLKYFIIDVILLLLFSIFSIKKYNKLKLFDL